MIIGLKIDQIAIVAVSAAGVLVVVLGVAIVVMGWKDADVKDVDVKDADVKDVDVKEGDGDDERIER